MIYTPEPQKLAKATVKSETWLGFTPRTGKGSEA